MNASIDHVGQRAAWWAAVRNKDYSALEDLLSQGFDLEDLSARSETGFLFCAGNGMFEQAQWFKDHGANPNATDLTGANALHLAIRRGAVDDIDPLVALGVDVNAQDQRGATPLLLATTHEHKAYDLVSSLLTHGAEPNIAARSTSTPLLVSAAGADLRVMDLLLDSGADYLAVGARGNLLHSLLESSAKDSEDATIRMIDRFPDLDVNQLSRAGSTALGFAVARGARKALKALLKAGADPNERAVSKLGNRMSALMLLACGPVDKEAYELAFAKGADPEMTDEGGYKALSYALASGMSEEEGKQIEEAFKGQKVSEKDLREAVDGMLWARKMETIDALLAGGASPTAPLFADGRSAYHVALSAADKEKRIEAIQWLASRHFAPTPGRVTIQFPVPKENWATNVGELAMVNTRDEDTVQALLDAGLDPARVDEASGKTLLHAISNVDLSMKEHAAIEIAKRKLMLRSGDEQKDKEAVESLQKQVADLVENVESWRVNMFNRLVEITGTADVPDSHGLTPLGHYVARGGTRLAEAALAAGADPMRRDEDGDNVISVAIKTGNIEWAHRLVAQIGEHSPALQELFLDMTYGSPEAGSRVPFVNAMRSFMETPGGVAHWLNIRDENGNTPLIVAAATKQEDLVDSFLVMGADPNAAANDGNTALHHAIMQDRGDIVKALLSMGADRELRNQAGKNALDLALICRTPFIIKAVQEGVGEKPTFELDEATKEAAKMGREKAQAVAQAPAQRRMGM